MGQRFSMFCCNDAEKKSSKEDKVKRENAPVRTARKEEQPPVAGSPREERPPCSSPRRPSQ